MRAHHTLHITARDGQRLGVRCIGEGEPCVLLHGFAMDSRYWLPFAWALRRRYRFILPDLRGFGLSHDTRLDQDCALTCFAQDLEAILDHFNLDDVALGGISMGAFAALRYQELYQFKRVGRYAHIDQSPRVLNTPEWPHGIFGAKQGPRIEGLQRLLVQAREFEPDTPYKDLPSAFRKAIWGEFGLFTEASMGSPLRQAIARKGMSIEKIGTQILPMRNWFTYMAILGAYLEQDYDMRPSLGDIDIPVTVMIGMRSRMYPPEGQREVVRRIPGAREVRFERSGHSLIWDEALKFQRELTIFLKG